MWRPIPVLWTEAARHKFCFSKFQKKFHESLENERDSLLATMVKPGEVVFTVHATTLTDLILNKSHLTRCSLLLSFPFHCLFPSPSLSYPLLNLSSQTVSLTLTPPRSVTSHLSRWNWKSVMVIFYGNLRGEFPNASAVSGWKLGYGSPELAVVEETHLWGVGGSLVSQVTPTAWEIRVGSGWCHACKEALPGPFHFTVICQVLPPRDIAGYFHQTSLCLRWITETNQEHWNRQEKHAFSCFGALFHYESVQCPTFCSCGTGGGKQHILKTKA